jgi:hypothetical protein
MTRRDEEKNMEVRKLDQIVNSYMEKIGELEQELNRLEKNSLSLSNSMNSQNNVNQMPTFVGASVSQSQPQST